MYVHVSIHMCGNEYDENATQRVVMYNTHISYLCEDDLLTGYFGGFEDIGAE